MDDILKEIREYRDSYAKRFNYDLEALHRDIKEREKNSGRQIVSFAQVADPACPAANSSQVETLAVRGQP